MERRVVSYRVLAGVALCLSAIACSNEVVEQQLSDAVPAKAGSKRTALADEIPASELAAVARAHLQGVGHMERYEYDQAANSFREVRKRAPGWIPGSINLAIALLNQSGSEDEASKRTTSSRFDEALTILSDVLKRAPGNLHAHYCRGIILEHLGRMAEAHREFEFVTVQDPADAHAWYWLASTLVDPEDPERPAGPRQAKALIELYQKAVDRNPYLVSALYKLMTAYGWAGERDKQKALFARWQRLNPEASATGPGEITAAVYGEMGRYATVVDPISAPGPGQRPEASPRFEPPADLVVRLAPGFRWVKESDFSDSLAVVGRARARFGAAVAAFDANGDGRTDLYLASAVAGPNGVRDLLLLNNGAGGFDDATARYGLADDVASLGVAAADFDADRRTDLLLTGPGRCRLLRNLGERFDDVTQAAGVAGPNVMSLTARWLDLDQDGDLDLFVINHARLEDVGEALTEKHHRGARNSVYRNDGVPPAIKERPRDNWAPIAVAPTELNVTAGLSIAFSPWPEAENLCGDEAPHTALAALDLDDDRDLDLVLSADGTPTRALLNDRLGKYHQSILKGFDPAAADGNSSAPISGLLVGDFDKDGRTDLAALRANGPVDVQRNATKRGPVQEVICERWPANPQSWRSAVLADLDLDSFPDLLGLPARQEPPTLAWAHNEGSRLTTLPLAYQPNPEPHSLTGFGYADLVGDPLPDLLTLREGASPQIARNLGNGRHWLALAFSGRWHVRPEQMRTNPEGLGVRLTLEGQGLHVTYEHTTTEAGLVQSVSPVVLGLGSASSAALLRLRWPDGTMQSELNLAADRLLAIAEHNRKTGSCPVLFTWNGDRFVCIGDFLGGGGLGYLIAPGVYGDPDRDEAVAIEPEQLREVDGAYRLVVTEPMDEVAYLDHLTLDVIDGPPGASVVLDERFAPDGPRPSGWAIAYRTRIEPERATDLLGQDVTKRLEHFDRLTVDRFRKRPAWIGYADEHGIVLDFGDRLSALKPRDPLLLCLAGWVEYPYSQTNYAAATAGVTLSPPVLERQRDDGTWEVIEAHAGYPAGLPRMTSLDMTGKLVGPRCVIRLRTNMECYWDQAFVAVPAPAADLRVTSLLVAGAQLTERGYTRESSSDGRPPLLYDYDRVEPAPLARLRGRLTRLGDVADLLRSEDDHLCLVGPGDEVRLEFDARAVPALSPGWTRSFVLRSIGYCKDADPFSGGSDTVGPLPWKGMPAYPFGPAGERPRDAKYDAYLRDYQTREAGDP